MTPRIALSANRDSRDVCETFALYVFSVDPSDDLERRTRHPSLMTTMPMTMTTPIHDGCARDAPVARACFRDDDVVIDKDWTTNDGRDATRRFYRGFASHRGGDDDDDDGFDERDERGP